MSTSKLDPDRLYYKISDVAKMLEIKESTLRYWEDQFTQLNPSRTKSNRRQYREQDIKIIKKIQYLLKTKGISIDQAKYELSNQADNEQAKFLVISKLMEMKKKLKELLAHI